MLNLSSLPPQKSSGPCRTLHTAHRKATAREQIDGPDEEDDASEEDRLREGFEMLADEVDEDDGLPPGMRGIKLL